MQEAPFDPRFSPATDRVSQRKALDAALKAGLQSACIQANQIVRSAGILLLALSLLQGGAGGQQPQAPVQAPVRTIALTRTVRIPLGLEDGPGVLPVSPGAEDEPPEGPAGFDVLDDGSFLISDSLVPRISIFDAQGKFRRAWNIGYASDSVTALRTGAVVVREASTGLLHALNREGEPVAGSVPALPETARARLIPGEGGSVAAHAGAGPIAVRFNRPGYALLSLQALATDQKGNTYVALEYSNVEKNGEGIDVDKTVRKYAPDGTLLGETTEFPLDYYIKPVDELRIHNGVVYQLMSTRTELEINVWDTNQ
jgi:hypothetical protein